MGIVLSTTSRDDIEIAIAAAAAGARVTMSSFGHPVDRYAKKDNDFATAADIAAERAIRHVLSEAVPNDAITGEELASTGAGRRRWLVDPICGTFNFASGVPLFAVNVALEIEGIPTVAAVAEPSTGISYAGDLLAAFRRYDGTDQPLCPSPDSLLVDINLDYDYPSTYSAARLLHDTMFCRRFAPRVLATSLALAWVAAGKTSAYLCGADPHGSVHFAAGVMLCQAAGAVVTNFDGNPLLAGEAGFIAAADSTIHAAILRRLHELA